MRKALAGIALLCAASACNKPVTPATLCNAVTCSGHGSCVDVSGAAACLCEAGFVAVGLECRTLDPCDPDPCAEPHRARCSASGATAVCSCDEGYRDDGRGGCVAPDPCTPNPCVEAHRSTCRATGGAAVCSCDEGYWDVGACVPAVSCEPNPCTGEHRTSCVLVGTEATCTCDEGYVDDGSGVCTRPDPCEPNPCVAPHRSICGSAGTTATCSCDPGYRDDGQGQCSPAGDPCEPNPCTEANRSVCKAAGGIAVCSCDAGLRDDGLGHCVGNDPCDPNPCTTPHRTACTASGVTVFCSCDSGFRDDGAGGCVEACAPNPCTAAHQTICGPGPGGFQCSCDYGYVADGSGRCRFQTPSECLAAHEAGDAYEPDECPELARLVIPPISSEGHTIDRIGDVDWVAVDVEDGEAIVVSARAVNSLDVDLAVFDFLSRDLLASASGKWGLTSLAVRPGARRLLVRVQSQTSWTAAYQLTIERFADDRPNSAAEAQPLPLAVPVSGDLEYGADVDWFSFSAIAGHIYQVDVTHVAAITCELYDESGASSPSGKPLTSASQFNEGVLSFGWRATVDGTYYLKLLPEDPNTLGTYEVVVTDQGADDHGDVASQATKLTIGSWLTGSLAFSSDEDWFTFDAVPGHIHQVKVESSNTTYAELYDSAKAEIANGYSHYNSGSILVKLGRTDPYYVRVWQSPPPLATVLSYQVKVIDLGLDDHGDSASEATPVTPGQIVNGSVQFSWDADWFSLATVPGRVYEVALSMSLPSNLKIFAPDGTTELCSGVPPWPLSFGAGSEGPYYLAIVPNSGLTNGTYQLTVAEKGTDDYGNSAALAVPLSLGIPVHGTLEYRGDEDWFSVALEAKHIYRMDFAPSGYVGQARVLQGTTAVASMNASPASFAAPASATYQVVFGSWYGSSTGAYTLVLTDVGVDDHGDTAADATPIALGASTSGSIEYAGDLDWLSLATEAHHIYRVTVVPSGLSASVRVLGSDAKTEVGSQASNGPMELVFLSSQTGNDYLKLGSQFAGGIGTYTALAEDLGTDDAGNTTGTAVPLTVGSGPVAGAIQYKYPADVDVYSFQTVAAGSLNVTLDGPLSTTWQVSSATGSGWILASGHGPGIGNVTIPNSGTWYVTVGTQSPGMLGQYSLQVAP
jgi:hypothetical protein